MRDVEIDLKNNREVCEKIAASDVFAQNVYAALCNQQYYPHGEPQTDDTVWSCTWRYAGGIIADIRNTHLHKPQDTGIVEDYIHWYCSGMGYLDGKVEEGVVTREVRELFAAMGWDIVAYPNEWGV
jgi:hypothetical protein